MSELLPCPFCGCHEVTLAEEFPWRFYALCNGCWSRSNQFHEKEDVFFAWNKRVCPPNPEASAAGVSPSDV
jgi:hypothetical protein